MEKGCPLNSRNLTEEFRTAALAEHQLSLGIGKSGKNGTDLSDILNKRPGSDAGQECPASLFAIACREDPSPRRAKEGGHSCPPN